jgi:hypothetical protein
MRNPALAKDAGVGHGPFAARVQRFVLVRIRAYNPAVEKNGTVESEEKELLAEFHHTISEQLNARLSESPKFFGLLVIVSTAYGYVLSNTQWEKLIPLATGVSLAATIWAAWYLAALGYAFRFLQNIQHSIERAVGWNRYSPTSGKPPGYANPLNWYWLLPGIYHAHAAGLSVLFTLICFTGMKGSKRYTISVAGIVAIALLNLRYFYKFKKKRLRLGTN